MKYIEYKCANCGASVSRKPTKTENHYCNNNCKSEWQKKQREKLGYTKEWLEKEYYENRKSANQIAREIGRDPKRVWEWIRDYGLQTRERGTDYGQNFKEGHESAFKGCKHSEETKEKIRNKRIEDGHVPYLVNGVHWMKAYGRKPASWKGGITPERQALYSTPEWKQVWYAVMNRDKKTCQRCGIVYKKGIRLDVHHLVSFMDKEKRTEESNLIVLCYDCHKWVHSKKNINRDFIKE